MLSHAYCSCLEVRDSFKRSPWDSVSPLVCVSQNGDLLSALLFPRSLRFVLLLVRWFYLESYEFIVSLVSLLGSHAPSTRSTLNFSSFLFDSNKSIALGRATSKTSAPYLLLHSFIILTKRYGCLPIKQSLLCSLSLKKSF